MLAADSKKTRRTGAALSRSTSLAAKVRPSVDLPDPPSPHKTNVGHGESAASQASSRCSGSALAWYPPASLTLKLVMGVAGSLSGLGKTNLPASLRPRRQYMPQSLTALASSKPLRKDRPLPNALYSTRAKSMAAESSTGWSWPMTKSM